MSASPPPQHLSTHPSTHLSTAGAVAQYVGALLGPSLLLLPGLAARMAGPSSLLAWLALLVLSGLIATVFCRLGVRFGSASGAAGYVAAGLGPRAGRAAVWCFLTGVVAGAPVVCTVGGAYVAELLGTGGRTAFAASVVLLVLVLAMRLAGARTGARLQLALVALLIALVVVAVAGAAPAARAANWRPFAPHGWQAAVAAASPLMLAFVGWEAAAPLTARMRDPRRGLPRVVAAAFAVTAVLYLALAAATVGVLGPRAGGAVPLADLLRVAVGGAGPAVAAAGAVVLTLAATNAYLTGATAMAAELLGISRPTGIVVALAAAGALLLGLTGAGLVTADQLVNVPTTLFLMVYLGSMAAAVRVLTGRVVRLAAGVSCVVVAGLLVNAGWAAAFAAVVALLGAGVTRGRRAGGRAARAAVPAPAPERSSPVPAAPRPGPGAAPPC